MSNIPAGYYIHIDTYESSHVNQTTQIFSGLTIEDARFYIELAKIFTDEVGSNGVFSNDFVPINTLKSIMLRLQKQHPNLSERLAEDLNTATYDLADLRWLIHQVLCAPVDECYYSNDHSVTFCRGCDQIQVYYIKEEIVDLAQEFNCVIQY
jgi:hypothetical protein